MKLYDYFRSTASYRVRIALHLKGLSFEQKSVHLVRDGGEQHTDAYRAINPQALVPSLVLDDGTAITQSLAILEYLEEAHPSPPLLPESIEARAYVRSLSLLIAADMHPISNLRVLKQLKSQFHADEAAVTLWYHNWLKLGFDAFEARLQDLGTGFCYGNTVSFADICLVGQVFNARRFKFDLEAYPKIEAIDAHCKTIEAFQKAAPEVQPDA